MLCAPLPSLRQTTSVPTGTEAASGSKRLSTTDTTAPCTAAPGAADPDTGGVDPMVLDTAPGATVDGGARTTGRVTTTDCVSGSRRLTTPHPPMTVRPQTVRAKTASGPTGRPRRSPPVGISVGDYARRWPRIG